MKAIDLFAGWGGFTLGAQQAGHDVLWAANHWPLAVEAHELNHPGTTHVCQDLRQANWSLLPDYELLLASPACQGHSQASQPRRRAYHDELRASAWAVVECADTTEPKAIVVENVIDFRRWRLFPLWTQALEQLGYKLDQVVVRASLHGAPQRRDRLFVIATRHGADLRGLGERRGTEAPFGPCIEADAPGWKPIALASPKVQERIERSRKRHGRRFLTQHTRDHMGVPLHEPIRTITTGDQWALVDGDLYRPLTVRENARAMGFPDEYSWPAGATRRDQIKGLGNAVCPPVAARVIERVAAAA